MKNGDNEQWKTDEVNYRLVKMVLQNLQSDGLLSEPEVQQVLQRLRANWSPLIARIEENE